MYFNTITSITINYLHDAALSLSFNPEYRLRSIYVDNRGECAISYYGKLKEYQIKEIMRAYCYPHKDIMMSEIEPERYTDYDYDEMEEGKEFTTIYTPDGINYKKIDYKVYA